MYRYKGSYILYFLFHGIFMYSKHSKFSFSGVRDNDDTILICAVKTHFNNHDIRAAGASYPTHLSSIYTICINSVVLFYFNMYFNYHLKFSSVG